MRDEMEHERMRFRTMNPNQLITRLNKITREDKLRRYIIVAEQVGYTKLADMAMRKLSTMLGQTTIRKETKIRKEVTITKTEEIINVVQEIFSLRPARKFSFD